MRPATKRKTGNRRTDWASLRPRLTKKLLGEITARIVAQFRPQKVILFGSSAYGSPNLDSDVDLLVIMDIAEPMARRIMRVSEVAQVPFLPMDILVHTPSEIVERQAKGDFFMEEILTKGKVLYSNDTAR